MRLMFNFPDADSAEAAELQFASERRQQIRAMVKAGFPEAPEGEASRPLRNGDTVAMTVAGVRHEAVVYFNRDFIQVSLLAPYEVSTGFRLGRKQAHMARYVSPELTLGDGLCEASPAGVAKAWEHFGDLCCDVILVHMEREELAAKYPAYLQREKEVRAREVEQNRTIQARIESLRKEKTALKRLFKDGGISEKQYKEHRSDLIGMIHGAERKLLHEDVFGRVFGDELDLLQAVSDPREFIAGVAIGEISAVSVKEPAVSPV